MVRKTLHWLKFSDLTSEQKAGFVAMAEKFPQYHFSQNISQSLLNKLERSGKIDAETLEQGRANSGGGDELTHEEKW